MGTIFFVISDQSLEGCINPMSPVTVFGPHLKGDPMANVLHHTYDQYVNISYLSHRARTTFLTYVAQTLKKIVFFRKIIVLTCFPIRIDL